MSESQELSASLHVSRDKAVKNLAEYAKEYWSEHIEEEWTGMSDADVIAQYFDPGRDAYEIKEMPVDTPLDTFKRF